MIILFYSLSNKIILWNFQFFISQKKLFLGQIYVIDFMRDCIHVLLISFRKWLQNNWTKINFEILTN